MKTYLVVFSWATEECQEVETHCYSTYKKALKAFKQVKACELDPDVSWVGDVFDENGKYDKDRYDVKHDSETTENGERSLFWGVYNLYNGAFSEIYLRILDIE